MLLLQLRLLVCRSIRGRWKRTDGGWCSRRRSTWAAGGRHGLRLALQQLMLLFQHLQTGRSGDIGATDTLLHKRRNLNISEGKVQQPTHRGWCEGWGATWCCARCSCASSSFSFSSADIRLISASFNLALSSSTASSSASRSLLSFVVSRLCCSFDCFSSPTMRISRSLACSRFS
jgi:hypothetical protein